MLESWKELIKQAAHAFTDWLEQENRSFYDIASFIRSHPDTTIKKQTWLGLTYRFYSLRLNHVTLSMETKKTAREEHILFISVIPSHAEPIVYRSYDEQSDLNTIVKVPPLTENAASMQ
ncbi:hypothetical protein [Anoxybacteroides tepidamans]|uniref:hypothetical protein n=1 Tax=Anoxybacteroides tepidamans TaxID=265948 RepID=UPI0004802D4A|nr:hypothetical protein [Anoxybacillus tepidamans]